MSEDGAARARRLARELFAAGVVVVSGLAKGVDTAALTSANLLHDDPLCQALKDELAMHIADRERLRLWIVKARAAAGRPARRKAVGPVAANTRNSAASDR